MLSNSHQVSFSYFEIFFLKAVSLGNRVKQLLFAYEMHVQVKQERQYSEKKKKKTTKNF